MCRLNVSYCTQQYCARTSKRNRRNKISMSPTLQLRSLSWKCDTAIHCKWNDYYSTIRRILPLRKTSTESIRQTLLPNKPQRRNIKQWSRAHHLHNQTHNGISFRSRTGCHILKSPRIHSSPYHVRKNGPSATPHQHHCQKFNGAQTHTRKNDSEKIQRNGHAFPLEHVTGSTRPSTLLMLTGENNPADYHTKNHPPQHHRNMRT